MKYPRYGKFQFFDYVSGWVAIVAYLTLGIGGLFTDIQYCFLALPILFSVITAWSIYKPHTEHFIFNDGTFTTIKGKKSKTIDIPDGALFVIAYADVWPPLAKRIGSLKTYFLKGRFSVIILNNISLSDFFDKMHTKFTFKYTNSTVELCAEDAFIYSFVCTQEILDKLPIKETHQVIIPESLMQKVTIGKNAAVIVDRGF